MVAKMPVPVLIEKQPQLMAVITTKGDPNVVMEKAMPALYGAVYHLKFQLKKQGIDFKVGKLIGRWPDAHLVPQNEWTGIWGLPVPSGTTELLQKSDEYPVRIELWEYGTVAEILHVGPYSEEGPAVERLHNFIEENGFEITGSHEEEYLTKPTSKVVKTIIRYPVGKKA
ncbi:MAG: hypothetical protein A4E52_00451 [Pelotomaculum sp. PtaB.Bin013]|uniref:GyrI-like domain-containing protein n=1 Tax=Pelotomaculum isophthalicicum JI TaxID=947010 RepID=A0A9X4JU26_9FIRM|nr:GyrI-like domain-containing protein [Pelotomaculum isophthalicicum]MDF9408395.1 GyrI-like domain-containing protein [Pelotomaculum isophthalicicum JI]OPX91555.1 MAG: hypothetical protein A4E52_00451 [Pelotomaculum sp. PtaB.Bin013]